jgi:hypothetical protein
MSIPYWRKQGYSDECTFDTSKRGSVYVTRKVGEYYHPDCVQYTHNSGRASVMVWGMIGYNWKSKLIFLEGTGRRGVCGRDYLEQVLKPYVAPMFKKNCKNSFPGFRNGGAFLEDNAPVHGTKKLLVDAKKKLGIYCHVHPPSSPDLNPIEKVWHTLK